MLKSQTFHLRLRAAAFSVDRSIVPILIHDDHVSPNEKANPQAAARERILMVHGASLIRSACRMLQLSPSCCGTASVMFHRYFFAQTQQQEATPKNQQPPSDVWSMAMASVLIAAKTQEVVLTCQQVIVVFAHLFRKRRLIYLADTNGSKVTAIRDALLQLYQDIYPQPTVATTANHSGNDEDDEHDEIVAREASWTWSEKQAFLSQVSGLSPLGPVYQEWNKALTQAENVLLRQLGFTLHWIPHSHPHQYLPGFLELVMEGSNSKEQHPSTTSSSSQLQPQHDKIRQMAWNYCNDSFLLDFCIRYPASIVAGASVYLACLQSCLTSSMEENQTSSPLAFFQANADWATLLCGSSHHKNDSTSEIVATVANALLALQDENANMELQVALHAYCPPLTKDCFNGPDSFLWDFGNTQANQFQQERAATTATKATS